MCRAELLVLQENLGIYSLSPTYLTPMNRSSVFWKIFGSSVTVASLLYAGSRAFGWYKFHDCHSLEEAVTLLQQQKIMTLLVSKRNIPEGAFVSRGDFETQYSLLPGNLENLIPGPEEVLGQKLLREVRKGDVIEYKHFRRPPFRSM